MRAVCIPWRGGDPDRDYAFAVVREMWERNLFDVYTGDSGDEKFNRAASRNAAVAEMQRHLTGDDRNYGYSFIVSDADVKIEDNVAETALGVAYLEDVLVFPHSQYRRQGPDGRVTASSHGEPTNGGAVAISGAAWGYLNGYDPRLGGWGFEDAAFLLAAETMLGESYHLEGIMTEFHHYRPQVWRQEDRDLYLRYKAARGKPLEMHAIVEEHARV